MGPNRDLILRKVQVDIYQKANRANPSDKRLVHVKTVRWNLREYRKRYHIAVKNLAVRARMLDDRDRRQLQFPLQVQVYGATLNFVANEDFRANPKTPGIFSVNTDARRTATTSTARRWPPARARRWPTSSSGPPPKEAMCARLRRHSGKRDQPSRFGPAARPHGLGL